MMNVKEIVADYLTTNGYDGLCNADIQCGCGLDDLFPCVCMNETSCVPGYKAVCNAGCGDFAYCIFEEKQRGCKWDERVE